LLFLFALDDRYLQQKNAVYENMTGRVCRDCSNFTHPPVFLTQTFPILVGIFLHRHLSALSFEEDKNIITVNRFKEVL